MPRCLLYCHLAFQLDPSSGKKTNLPCSRKKINFAICSSANSLWPLVIRKQTFRAVTRQKGDFSG